MKKRVFYAIIYFGFWLLLSILVRPIFYLFYYTKEKTELVDLFSVMKHAFVMDLSTTGYMSALGIAVILISCFFKFNKVFDKVLEYSTYFLLFIFLVIVVADITLYKYWGFRIDNTPLFYLKSPKEAMASGSIEDNIFFLVMLLILCFLFFKIFKFIHVKFSVYGENKSILGLLPILLFGGLIFLFIRGGVGVSTMNAGRVYFSKSTFLNHSALNPVWNFIYSLSKENNFGDKYKFFDDDIAKKIFEMNLKNKENDNFARVLNTNRPNIFVVVLESCGSSACEAFGGEKNVMPCFCSYFNKGISFTNFYANSFRTDRGLMAIMSGYPAQPTTSLMKYTEKSHSVEKFPLSLKNHGYDLSFYYGGDENFTNMRSYLVMSGFEKIVSEKDFDSEDMSEKWGAYDHALFRKISDDLKVQIDTPFCKVILTLNSHEPFDVPMHRFENKYLNAVAYTDSCLGVFLDDLKNSKWWKNSLVVLLPDHAYCYPDSLKNFDVARHKIPMMWIGGAVKEPLKVTDFSSQIDLSCTLLNQLDIDASDFIFSKNILSEDSPKFAFYTFNDGFGIVTSKDSSVYDCAANVKLQSSSDSLLSVGKVFLQTLMQDFSER